MKNVISILAKIALLPLGLIAAGSTADSGMHKKVLDLGIKALIIPNDEMENIMKIVKFLEYSGLLLKGFGEKTQNGAKKQKSGFFSMLLVILDSSLLGNMLAEKEINRAGNGIIRDSYGSNGSLTKNL